MRGLLLLSALCGLCLSFPSQRLNVNKGRHARDLQNATGRIGVFKQIYEVNKNLTTLDPRRIITQTDVVNKRKRQSSNCEMGICLWPRSSDGIVYVPYTIGNEYKSMELAIFRSVFNDFEDNTCIRFIPRESQKDFLSFQDVSGCFSSIGCTGGSQVVSLARPGCMWTGIVTHEILHALGLSHEHIRKDRDNYIAVQWNNILPLSKYNFVLGDSYNTNLTSYDYKSIMHYSRTAFSVDGVLPTLVAIPDNSIDFGQQLAMSELDYKKINKLYSCDVKVTSATTQPTTTKTTTRSTTTTTTTTTTTPTTTKAKRGASFKCGGNLTAPSGVIQSPDYPANYPSNVNCIWNITSSLKITISFTDFDIEQMPTCLWDSVTIYDGPTQSDNYLYGRYCGKKLPPKITSYANSLLVVLKSDAHVEGKGFKLLYQTG